MIAVRELVYSRYKCSGWMSWKRELEVKPGALNPSPRSGRMTVLVGELSARQGTFWSETTE